MAAVENPGSRFDDQPVLVGETLELKPLRRSDLDGLAAAAGEPETWAGHPAKERYKREIFEPYFHFLVDAGGTLAIRDRRSGDIIGCSRYYPVPDQQDTIGIGFTFLRHTYWGGVTNFELKRLMLDHAFKRFQSVWFHIAPTNIRSQKATMKLGAVHCYDAVLDISGTPTEWKCYRLDNHAWQAAKSDRALREAAN